MISSSLLQSIGQNHDHSTKNIWDSDIRLMAACYSSDCKQRVISVLESTKLWWNTMLVSHSGYSHTWTINQIHFNAWSRRNWLEQAGLCRVFAQKCRSKRRPTTTLAYYIDDCMSRHWAYNTLCWYVISSMRLSCWWSTDVYGGLDFCKLFRETHHTLGGHFCNLNAKNTTPKFCGQFSIYINLYIVILNVLSSDSQSCWWCPK